ncbi:hypothetical protein B4U80_15074, partial [Leptotrombidium deliense]
MSINILPEELLKQIFSYLTISERISIQSVCKKWLLLSDFSDVRNINFIARSHQSSKELYSV